MTNKEREGIIKASESVLCAIHNVRRALKFSKHPIIKTLGEASYANLVNFDDAIRLVLERR